MIKNAFKTTTILTSKAFIFDMDGVIINSEPIWEKYENKFLPELIGKNTYAQIKNQILGNSVSGIYDAISKLGIKISKKKFEQVYDQYAELVYAEAQITDDISELINKLILMGFKIGLVSSSRQYWIDLVIKKMNAQKLFQSALSLDGNAIKAKPLPDGYLLCISQLNSKPNQTVILEDSPKGLAAAQASGALAICLTENLNQNCEPRGADIYVRSVSELMNRFEELIKI